MKRHLDAGNALPAEEFIDGSMIGFFIMRTMRSEEDNTVTGPAFLIAIPPVAACIELDNRIDPTRAVKVGPLIGEAQVRFDNLRADGLEIDAACITSEVAA